MPMPDSKVALWTDELRLLECSDCAYHAIRALIREVHFAPAIADVLDEYRDRHAKAHQTEDPALPALRWTEEDTRASDEARLAAMAAWNEHHGTQVHVAEQLVDGIGGETDVGSDPGTSGGAPESGPAPEEQPPAEETG